MPGTSSAKTRFALLPGHDDIFFSCGRAVDECDGALTQGTALLRVIWGCGARESVRCFSQPQQFIQEYPMATSAAAVKEDPATTFAKDQLKAIIERIERLEEEKKTISDDIRDVYAEAKGNGFDVKALRTIVRLRKQDANERAEEETILETYMQALGML
jgi:uncharacterized protein (UPF0335 family)